MSYKAAIVFLCIASAHSASAAIVPVLKTNAASVPIDSSLFASVLVIDEASGKTLFKKEPDKIWSAASLTKLATSRVFTSTPTPWDGTADIRAEDEVEGGRLRVDVGTKLTFRDLLFSTIVGSANNTANALARWFDSSPTSAFISRMNHFASERGLAATHYVDASGISPDNKTNAYDVAVMLHEAAQNGEIQQAMVTPYYKFTTISPVLAKTIKNTNDLLFYAPDIIVTGGKTGFLYESQYNYAVRLHPKDDSQKTLVIVVLGASARDTGINASAELARWAWANFSWQENHTGFTFTQNHFTGEKGEDIRQLQKLLNANGFAIATSGAGSRGHETTLYGGLTQAAVKRFQDAHADEILTPYGRSEGSGYLDFATRAALNELKAGTVTVPESSTSGGITLITSGLGFGAVNDEVRLLQQLLSRETDVYPEKIISGYFGPLTQAAVQRFQLKHGVVSSPSSLGYGYVGPATRAKLSELYGS